MSDPMSIDRVPPHAGLPDWTKRQQGQSQGRPTRGVRQGQNTPAHSGEGRGDEAANSMDLERAENQPDDMAPAAGSPADVGSQVDCEA